MTDPQFEILRNEIRDGFKASVQRDAALSAKMDAMEARLSDISYALNSVMTTLLNAAENRDIRSRMKTPHEAADAQREVRP